MSILFFHTSIGFYIISKMSDSETTKKVYVGMSGGVDSSVAAALLKEQNFDVVGVFIKIWHPTISNCDWKSEMRDAMRACAHLHIPFKMIDLSDLYFEKVIGYMINEYENGRTPNPDVMCNEIIKFGAFYDWALNEGAQFVATGHYAQISEYNNEIVMSQGVDSGKDQTYFLWRIKKEQLKNILFPVGSYTKSEIRKLAEKFSLPNAAKKDSQGLCFIGDINVKQFLKNHIDAKQGDVLNVKGEVIGSHDGAFLYTYGERHGFIITNNSSQNKPHFVIGKDLEKNTITVSEEISLVENVQSELVLEDYNKLVSDSVDTDASKNIVAMCRYHAELIPCSLEVITETSTKISFKNPQERIAEGQSVVLYSEGVCIGGGVVSSLK